MRWLARASIANAVLVHLLIVALVLVGVYSLIKLPRELMSEIAFNWVFVRIDLTGASAPDIEQSIAMPVEEALEKVENVSSIAIRAKENYAFFSIKFEQLDPDDFDTAFSAVKDELDGVALPEDAERRFVLAFSSQDFQPMVSVVLFGDLPEAEFYELADQIHDDIDALDGVGKIEMGGTRERRILVEVDPDRLAAFGLPMDAVAQALRAGNLNIPGGTLSVGPNDYILRTVGQFEAASEVGRVVLGGAPGGGLVRVDDVAQITDGYEEHRVLSRFEGQQAVTLTISKQAGGNSIELTDAIGEVAARWDERLGDRATVTLSGDTSVQIENMLGDLQTNALFGMILVVVVLWLFLGLRNALLTAVGIPLAFLATFIFMSMTGETLNGNSLFGLVLVLGIIVDDAIVLVENAARHRGLGLGKAEAIIEGVGEVAMPVVAAIATTIAAFLPLMLMPGIMGRFLRIIPVVVSMALVASLIEALVSMPCHLYEWGESDPRKLEARAAWFERVVRPYVRAMGWLVKAPLPDVAELPWLSSLFFRGLGWVLGAGPPLLTAAGLSFALSPESARPLGAAAGFGGGLVLLVLASLAARRDLPGRYGLRWANLVGLGLTTGLFILAVPGVLFAIFGPTGAAVAVLGLLAVGGTLGAVAGVRGAVAPMVRQLWAGMGHVRWLVFSGVYLGMVPLAGAIASTVDMDLFGGDEIPQFSVRVRMPEGTSLERTDRVIRAIEGSTRAALPGSDLKTLTANSGLLQTDSEWFIKPNVGQVVVDLPPRKERQYDIETLMARAREAAEGVPGPDSLELAAANGGPPTGADIELKLQGDDLDRLVELTAVVRAEMEQVPGVHDVRTDWVLGKTELRVKVDPDAAALLGANEADVGLALRRAFEGTEATRLQDDDEDVPVLVRYANSFRNDLGWIQRTLVPTADGGTVPFADVARVERGRSPDAIRRYEGVRTITIYASVDSGVTTPVAATKAVQARLADFDARFPGYRINYSGEFEEFQKSLEALAYLAVFGLLLVYMILGAQFRSFTYPVIIIGFTFPGALLGSAIALLVTGTPLSLLTMYGVVALLGIVVNDSLVLISFINNARAEGLAPTDAILEAGRVRLRPIVLTTVTTVFGLLPMALGLGGKSEAWGPMATTIVFGLLVATATTLFVIPPVYRCFVEMEAVAGMLRGAREA